MRVQRDGPEDGSDLVVVMGWGNDLDHENVEWFTRQFADAGYRVHAFQIPEVVADFDRELVAPVQEYAGDLDEFRLVGHSTGGLIGPFVDGAVTRTYLSPWWGYSSGEVGLDDLFLDLITKIPTTREVVPTGTATREEIGELATDHQLEAGSPWSAPSFLREARRAHDRRPPIGKDVVVFCTPRDPVVSVEAIGEAVSASQIVLYDGGHEWFSSPCRDSQRETLLTAVEEGTDALE